MSAVKLTQLSLSMSEGKVARWLVAEGSPVAQGQPIAEIETDKAIAEIESSATGFIHILVEEGAIVPVETTLAEINVRSISIPESPGTLAALSMKPAVQQRSENLSTRCAGKHIASPAARRVARELGIDLRSMQRPSPDERIMVRDLPRLQQCQTLPARDVVIAGLTASWQQIPHIHVSGELEFQAQKAKRRISVPEATVTDLLLHAMARALIETPELNGTFGKPSKGVHIALAMATPDGVLAPVIRDVQDLSIEGISKERARLVAAVRAGRCDRREFSGATVTLTNLGKFPVDFFSPIVSGPQIATVATGRILERAVVVNGAIGVGSRMVVNVAIDHRAADGICGARFLEAFQRQLMALSEGSSGV